MIYRAMLRIWSTDQKRCMDIDACIPATSTKDAREKLITRECESRISGFNRSRIATIKADFETGIVKIVYKDGIRETVRVCNVTEDVD